MMSEEALFEFDLTAPIAEVKVDPRCQHIALVVDNYAEGAFVDLGSELHWWAMHALHLDRDGARELAAALTAWADRGEPT